MKKNMAVLVLFIAVVLPQYSYSQYEAVNTGLIFPIFPGILFPTSVKNI